jgi:hypothetical protein
LILILLHFTDKEIELQRGLNRIPILLRQKTQMSKVILSSQGNRELGRGVTKTPGIVCPYHGLLSNKKPYSVVGCTRQAVLYQA